VSECSNSWGFVCAINRQLFLIFFKKGHLNTCPVGVATQDPVLREKFTGQPEHVINYFFLLAEDIREIMAKLGFKKFDELIGRTDKLKVKEKNLTSKESALNYEAILLNAQSLRPNVSIKGGSVKQIFELEKRLDQKVIELAKDVLDGKQERVRIEMKITNNDRTFGATLSNKISLKYKDVGLKDDAIHIKLDGSAGQSFGAFLAHGVTLELCGDANDYVGKGLSGGKIVIYPPETSPFKSVDAIIVGNVVLYGAITGSLYIRGQAAERFCVRNSGAIAVSEGCGDHGCE
jgi:glutamate synthase (NADPH/NADH)